MIIYLLTNKVTGKHYVGQTTKPLKIRLGQHKARANKGRKGQFLPICLAIRKYGWESFEVEILEELSCEEEMDMSEQFWINCYNSVVPNGYNLDHGGKSRRNLAPEARQRMAASQRGKIQTEETKRKRSEALLGRARPEEVRAKISASSIGKKMSDEARAKMSKAQKGRVLSDETKAKMSAARRGDKAWNAKFTWEQVDEIRRLYAEGVKQADLAERFGTHQGTISNIVRNKVWVRNEN